MQLSITNTFAPNTSIASAKFNTNFTDVSNWANGNIQNDNLGTFTGVVSWSQSNAAKSININHSGAGDADKAAIAVSSTTVGVLFSRMTTTQMNAISSPPEGLELYDLTDHKKKVYNGTSWLSAITSSADDVTIEDADGVLQVKDDGIDTDQLADDAVTTDKIVDGAITSDKIATGVNLSAPTIGGQQPVLREGTTFSGPAYVLSGNVTIGKAVGRGTGFSVSNPGGAPFTATVTFGDAFTNTPVVMLTVENSGLNTGDVNLVFGVTAVSTTGFTAFCFNGVGGTNFFSGFSFIAMSS